MFKQSILDELFILARDNPGHAGAKLAACITDRRGNIIAYGLNVNKTHPFQALFAPNKSAVFLHAETAAIKNALLIEPDLTGFYLYVARAKRPAPRSKEWITGLATPCKGCAAAIKHYHIKQVFHT